MSADHIVVIGRGRLIADTSIAEFTRRSSSGHVRVVSPRGVELAPLLERAGATVTVGDGHERGGLHHRPTSARGYAKHGQGCS